MPIHDSRMGPLILPLSECTDRSIAGGKAVGLGRLLRDGFDVLPGWCLTTYAYDEMEQMHGNNYAAVASQVGQWPEREHIKRITEIRQSIESWKLSTEVVELLSERLTMAQAHFPGERSAVWAVRSSATSEDGEDLSFAGIYKTFLCVSTGEIPNAVVACWASLWSPATFDYLRRQGGSLRFPKMAVILQPMVNPIASGVAYSSHPLTGQKHLVTINAVFGIAEPLVAGTACPDHFVLRLERDRREFVEAQRVIARKPCMRRMRNEGPTFMLRDEVVPEEQQMDPVLNEVETTHVARVVLDIEKKRGCPVDVEWAIDRDRLWVMQARPIAHSQEIHQHLPPRYCWSRANLKETLPELPSPLALDFFNGIHGIRYHATVPRSRMLPT